MDDPQRLDFQGSFCFYCTQGELGLGDSLSNLNGLPNRPNEAPCMWPFQILFMLFGINKILKNQGKVLIAKFFYDVTHLVGQQGEQGLLMALKQ